MSMSGGEEGHTESQRRPSSPACPASQRPAGLWQPGQARRQGRRAAPAAAEPRAAAHLSTVSPEGDIPCSPPSERSHRLSAVTCHHRVDLVPDQCSTDLHRRAGQLLPWAFPEFSRASRPWGDPLRSRPPVQGQTTGAGLGRDVIAAAYHPLPRPKEILPQ